MKKDFSKIKVNACSLACRLVMLVLHFFNKISPPQLRKQTGLSRENLRNCTGF